MSWNEAHGWGDHADAGYVHSNDAAYMALFGTSVYSAGAVTIADGDPLTTIQSVTLTNIPNGYYAVECRWQAGTTGPPISHTDYWQLDGVDLGVPATNTGFLVQGVVMTWIGEGRVTNNAGTFAMRSQETGTTGDYQFFDRYMRVRLLRGE